METVGTPTLSPAVIRPTAKDTEAALRDWHKEEVKTTTKQVVDLGKYYFATSTGAIALLNTLSEVSDNKWGGFEWAATLLFLVSGGIGLFLMLPRLHKGGFDMVQAVSKRARHAWWASVFWAALWTTGVILGGIGLFHGNEPDAPQGVLSAIGKVASEIGGLF